MTTRAQVFELKGWVQVMLVKSSSLQVKIVLDERTSGDVGRVWSDGEARLITRKRAGPRRLLAVLAYIYDLKGWVAGDTLF